MADPQTQIRITAKDETRAAINSAIGGLQSIVGAANRLPIIGSALTAAFSGAALTAGVKSIIDGADQLNKASQKYGVAVEQLSALGYAGKLADVSLEAIGTGLKKLSTNMLDTAAGTGEAKDAFKALGIDVEATKGVLKGSDQVLGEIADRFAGMEDGAGKTALAVKLFGRAGADLIPLLNQGSKGLADMKEEAEKLGVVVGGDLARASEEFNDNMTRLGTVTEAFGISIAQTVLPSLNQFAAQLVAGVKAAGGFWEALKLFGTINPFKNNQENIRAYTDELAQIERRLAYAIPEAERKSLEASAAALKKRIGYLKEIAAIEANAGAGRGRLDSKDIGPPTLAKAPVTPGDKKKEADDQIRVMQELGREYEKMWESAEKYVAGLEVQKEKGRDLTQAERQLLEVERLLPAEWAGAIRPLLERADALEKNIKVAAEAKRIYDETRTPEEKLAAAQIRLNELLDAGAISWDTYARAVFAAQDAYDEAAKKAKNAVDEMTEFAKQAAHNMQDAMADGFFNVMQGKFDDLADNFKQTIDRMVANLLASQLMNFLVGDFGKTGSIGGWLGRIFEPRAMGGPVTAGVPYMVGEEGPEIFVPRASGTIVPNGGAVAVYNTFHLSGPADRRSQQQIAAEVGAAVDRAMRRNR